MGFLKRLFASETPRPNPRVVDLRNDLDELTARVEWLAKDFRSLRGRITGGLRNSAPEEPEPDDPEEVQVQIPRMPPPRSDHLARRFRGF